jgi:hypothetical protein
MGEGAFPTPICSPRLFLSTSTLRKLHQNKHRRFVIPSDLKVYQGWNGGMKSSNMPSFFASFLECGQAPQQSEH